MGKVQGSTAVCLLGGGPEYQIKVSGASYHFEMNSLCGPMPIYKNGNEKPLESKHKFWTAVSLWAQQGQRVEGGLAVWDDPPGFERPLYPVREVMQCSTCGEQMYRADPKEEWFCWNCKKELNQ